MHRNELNNAIGFLANGPNVATDRDMPLLILAVDTLVQIIKFKAVITRLMPGHSFNEKAELVDALERGSSGLSAWLARYLAVRKNKIVIEVMTLPGGHSGRRPLPPIKTGVSRVAKDVGDTVMASLEGIRSDDPRFQDSKIAKGIGFVPKDLLFSQLAATPLIVKLGEAFGRWGQLETRVKKT